MFWSPGWWVGQALAFLARFLNDLAERKRAETALRNLGAASQAASARQEAERQEAKARAAGDAVADEPDDLRDLRPD
ncbi:MAG: peptidoglycan-binding protein [Methylobacterium sp.]|uniref:peptidoglycan-binding protein n=1 Tax=Methylobacterium sp. TaxID=409 RepID=UPI0025D6C385|nr:peptidoglycan-binding protein [Methylobacterium sp.]MBX9933247.1 peptidoglycan-binding protein [Methylobacterium sp.]